MSRHTRRKLGWWPGLLVLFLGLPGLGGLISGCGEEFAPKWRVQEYRLLAIQADPVTLKPGETTTLRVLDWAPEGTELSYEWEWCPVKTSAQNSYRCPLGDLQGDNGGMSAAPPADPSYFELGSGESVEIPYPASPEQVLELCQSIQEALAEAGEDSPIAGLLPTQDCERGYDISVRVSVTSGDEQKVVARKEMTLWTGSEEKNANPRQIAMQIRVRKPEDIAKAREQLDWVPKAGETSQDRWVDIPADEPLPVLLGIPFDTRALVEPDSVETWRPPVPKGSDMEESPPERETLVFDWLTTAGDIRDSQSIFREDLNDLKEAAESGWVAMEAPDGCTLPGESGGVEGEVGGEACEVKVWSIVRDGRLGLDWAERTLRIVGRGYGGVMP